MTGAAAFIAAILDRPGDDTPRLVYADWLDEQGGDGAWLRSPGYYTLCSPAEFGSRQLWWMMAGSESLGVPIGEVVAYLVPGCSDRSLGGICLSRADGFYYGSWRCLACSARRATRTGLGHLEWLRTRGIT